MFSRRLCRLCSLQPQLLPLSSLNFHRHIKGQWILSGSSLDGLLRIEPDGLCLLDSTDSDLVQGIGRATLCDDHQLAVDLSLYRYSSIGRHPLPPCPQHVTFKAAISNMDCGNQLNTLVLTGITGTMEEINGAQIPNSETLEQIPLQPKDTNPIIKSKHQTPLPSPIPETPSLNPFCIPSAPGGLWYIPHYLNSSEQSQLLQRISTSPDWQSLDKRRVQEFGGSLCPECQSSFITNLSATPLWLRGLGDSLIRSHIFDPSVFPNSFRLHSYEAGGEGIAPHTDGPIYVPLVALLSLESSLLFHLYPRQPPPEDAVEHYKDTFRFNRDDKLLSLLLEPGSLLVFDGAAYLHHQHGIDPVLSEQVSVSSVANSHALDASATNKNWRIDAGNLIVERQRRVSVTVRHLLSRCPHGRTELETEMKRAKRIWEGRNDANTEEDLMQSDRTEHSDSTRNSSQDNANSIQFPNTFRNNPSLPSSSNLETKVDQLSLQIQKLSQENSTFQQQTAGVLEHVTRVLLNVSEEIAAKSQK